MKIRKPLVVGIALATLLAVGGVAAAAHQFSDVPDSHTFHEDIAWLAENDITRGCNPPANDEFCPEDNVTRGQMAAFLHRFADSFASVPGPQGPEGPEGPAGPQGAAGQALIASAITPPNPSYSDVQVVDVPALPVSTSGPDTVDDGTLLFDEVELNEGTYLIQGTVQFFGFADSDHSSALEYGVARVFLDGVALGTTWTSDVPDDNANAAQGFGALMVDIPAGGGTLSVVGAVRTAESDGAVAGGNLIVTQFNE
ncbi:MAG TPA: S-layer homology domain-containing protein [Acidimicrobiia bacterium]|nr:S-layer homology domain-containing protein [Acidimicrobiia bacterium]